MDEPDTETFTITLAEDDDHGEFKSGTATKNITIKDDPDDQPPYVSFRLPSQDVTEQDSDSSIEVEFILDSPSGFANPSVAFEVLLESTADARVNMLIIQPKTSQ